MADYKITSEAAKRKSKMGLFFECDKRQQERLQKLSERPKISAKEKKEKDLMIAKAAEFVENGIPFDMAPDELKNHHFFKVGYDIAVRRKKALEYEQNKKIGGR